MITLLSLITICLLAAWICTDAAYHHKRLQKMKAEASPDKTS